MVKIQQSDDSKPLNELTQKLVLRKFEIGEQEVLSGTR